MKFLLWALLIPATYAQTDFHQPDLRKLFADHLYCEGDYLRAVEEYKIVLNDLNNDTVEFKLALSLTEIKDYSKSRQLLEKINSNSVFFRFAKPEQIKILYLQNDYHAVRKEFDFSDINSTEKKLRNFSYLYTETDSLPSPPFLILPFTEEEANDISSFYEMKVNLPMKEPLKAGLLSALLPGLGKIYTEEYSDAVFAAIATGVFSYLAYTNFKADHQFRGYLFTAVAGWFYAGNIYGAAASAAIYNARVNFSFTSLIDKYIKKKNYFLPDYGFCR
jgi:hypothetical protein